MYEVHRWRFPSSHDFSFFFQVVMFASFGPDRSHKQRQLPTVPPLDAPGAGGNKQVGMASPLPGDLHMIHLIFWLMHEVEGGGRRRRGRDPHKHCGASLF